MANVNLAEKKKPFFFPATSVILHKQIECVLDKFYEGIKT